MTHFIFSFIKYVLGVVELVLLLRLTLKFLAASANALVVRMLYQATDALVFPFKGIFGNMYRATGGIVDMSAVSAMIGYAIAAYLLIKLLRLLTND